ncbi:MAG: hypothetical protein K2H64_00705 [Desulfovibrio sp.]|nr:hypothetical protein [Desulfovibrio sp.]
MTDAISLDNPRLEPIWMTFVDLDDPHCIYPNFVCRDAPLSEANKIAFAGGNAENCSKSPDESIFRFLAGRRKLGTPSRRQ